MGGRWTQASMIAVACEERSDLGVGPFDALDPFALAAHHGIPIYPVDELATSPLAAEAVQWFTTTGAGLWSAALIPVDRFRIIIENTAHTVQRRRASIAHELAHYLLEHPFDEALVDVERRCRTFDKTREDQAKFLSGELLIPQRAARRAAFCGWTNDQVASHFGVSIQFAQMQMAGARTYAARALAKQARAGH